MTSDYASGGSDVIVVGLSIGHDASVCLMKNGQIRSAIQVERLTRVKHDNGYGQGKDVALEYCLSHANVDVGEVDLFVFSAPEFDRGTLGFGRTLNFASRHYGIFKENVIFVSHHLAHAFSAFCPSPFESSAVMVVDGAGNSLFPEEPFIVARGPELLEYGTRSRYGYEGKGAKQPESETYYYFGDNFKRLASHRLGTKFFTELTGGFGQTYAAVAWYIFGDSNAAGKVMGLAPYGRANAFDFHIFTVENSEVGFPEGWTAQFMSPKNWKGRRREYEDLANLVQRDLEEALVARAKHLQRVTKARNLCIAGGVGLNCPSNRRILDEAGFEELYIQPAANDPGAALGCAYFGHYTLTGDLAFSEVRTDFHGRTYGTNEIEQRLSQTAGLKVERVEDVARRAAELLATGKIVGWFQGGSEFGPRALGHRSILADPRRPEMKDHINQKVKGRESFRPFAPSVTIEALREFFELSVPSPFMLLTANVREDRRHLVPAVTHVDGSARVQTVSREDDPLFHELIEEFGKVTNVPVLLNTSFNAAGEPIVETPGDAVSTFLATGLDILVIDRFLVSKS